MVVVNDGLNKIRDLIANEISTYVLGTSNQAPSVNDTDLVAPVSATAKTPTVVTYDKMVSLKYILYPAEGNGNIYREGGAKASDGTLFDRTTFYDIVKDSTFEVHIRKRFYLRNG